jgi:hypothetical protein
VSFYLDSSSSYNAFGVRGYRTDLGSLRALLPSTRAGYEAFAKKKNFQPDILELEDGAAGLFLGPRTARKSLIWFHGKASSEPCLVMLKVQGGGYALPAADSHWAFLWDLIDLAKRNGHELRVMMLEYGEGDRLRTALRSRLTRSRAHTA